MPIEIKELLIEVKVSNTSNQATATAAPPKGAIVAECVDQVMTVINTSRER